MLLKRILFVAPSLKVSFRNFSAYSIKKADHSCQVLVIGGGSGGCAVAAKLVRRLGRGKVTVLEPSLDHYYQPLWTLVGAGQKTLCDTYKPNSECIPNGAFWIQHSAAEIRAAQNEVITTEGYAISYEFLVVAAGVKNDYEKIQGLKEALDDKCSGVSTIYSSEYAEKTWSDIKNFKGGDAVFTFSHPPIKCPGAPQKIAYLTDHYLRKQSLRSSSKVTYSTSMPVIFGVKKYADALMKVVEKRNIDLQLNSVLQEIRPDKKEATYLDTKTKRKITFHYDLLHVTPPMSPPNFLKKNVHLINKEGYLDVDKYTLQHTRYPNIYGLGDCTNTPNSKTAAAAAVQSWVLVENLMQTINNQKPKSKYSGYGACPLLTTANTCILAEFLYDGKVHETFPFDQDEIAGVYKEPVRAAPLRSFLNQRASSGFTSQSDPARRGEYYFELRIYNTREIERLANSERWKHSIVTLKLTTDLDTSMWKALTRVVEAGKQEFKEVQPILYPNNPF